MVSIDPNSGAMLDWSTSQRIKDLEDQLLSLRNSVARLGEELSPRIAEIHSSAFPNDMIGYPVHPPISISETNASVSEAFLTDDSCARAALVRARIRQRRHRETLFSSDLFADPAWDMLLDLYAAELEGHDVSVSSLCIAATVPTTTALRWIKLLSQRGWLERAQDPKDGRRINMRLSDTARESLNRYFSELSK